jgi:hypothetical protein
MLKPAEIIRAAQIASECVHKIYQVEIRDAGAVPVYRSPEQAALIVSMINEAIDATQPGDEHHPDCCPVNLRVHAIDPDAINKTLQDAFEKIKRGNE